MVANDAQTVEMRLHSQFRLEPFGEGRYRCAIPEEPSPRLVIVHHPGFLRGFWTVVDAELAKRGQAEVRLPPTCTLQVQVDTSQAPVDWIPSFKLLLSTFMRSEGAPNERLWRLLYTEVLRKLPAGIQERLIIDDLAPGCHYLSLCRLPPAGKARRLVALILRLLSRGNTAKPSARHASLSFPRVHAS